MYVRKIGRYRQRSKVKGTERVVHEVAVEDTERVEDDVEVEGI